MHERCGTVNCEFCRAFISITCRGRFCDRNMVWFFGVMRIHTHNLRFRNTVIQCGQCRRSVGKVEGSYENNCLLFNVIVDNGFDREEFYLRDAVGKTLVRHGDNTVSILSYDGEGYVVVNE